MEGLPFAGVLLEDRRTGARALAGFLDAEVNRGAKTGPGPSRTQGKAAEALSSVHFGECGGWTPFFLGFSLEG